MRQVLQKAFSSAVGIPAGGNQSIAVPADPLVIPVGALLKIYAASGFITSVNPAVLTGNGMAVVANWEADQAGTLVLASFNLAVSPTEGSVGPGGGLQAVSPLGGCLMEIDNTIGVDAEPVLLGGLGGVPQSVVFEVVGDLHNSAAVAEDWFAYLAILYEIIQPVASK